MGNPVLVEVLRGQLVESRHEGAVAVMDADGGADAKRRNERGLSAADFAENGGREKLAKRLAMLASPS